MDIQQYISSGIIESYVLGMTDEAENQQVEQMAAANIEVRAAIDSFSIAFEKTAIANGTAPDVTIKPFLMATLDFMGRMQAGEQLGNPPIISANSTLGDYKEWLDRPDMVLPADFKDFHAKIIGYTPQATTAIVWIKDGSPGEVHHDELEKFLIVEGTCDITIGENVHQLVPGDVLEIPLYISHSVRITSSIPCKVILQRAAVAA